MENSIDEIAELFNEPMNARNLNQLFDASIDDDSLEEFERLFNEPISAGNLNRMMEIIMPTSGEIDSPGSNIINMPLSISDFPSDGIIYTADAVMFHRDAIKSWLPTCNHHNYDRYGSFENLYSMYSKGSPMMNVFQLRELVDRWWGTHEKCWGLARSIAESAIAYKPAEDQQLYLFSGNGGYYVIQCRDAMDYLSMVQRYKLLFDRKPLAQTRDCSHSDKINLDLERRLAQQGIKLVSRGRKIWLAVGPADGMQSKLIAAFNYVPPPVTKPAPPKPYEPGPSHA